MPNPSARRNRTARSSASRVRTIPELIATVANRASRRSLIRHRPLILRQHQGQHRFRDRRHPPAAAVAAVTVQIPSQGIESFNPMIPTQTLPPMNPNRRAWWRRMWSLASSPAVVFLVLTVPMRTPAAEEQTFASPQDAVNALVVAATNHDTNALHSIFGPAGHDLISPDACPGHRGIQNVRPTSDGKDAVDRQFGYQRHAGNWHERLAVSHSAGQTGRPMVLRYRRRKAGGPRPPHRPGRIGRDQCLQRVCGGAARICQRGSPGGRSACLRAVPAQHARYARRSFLAGETGRGVESPGTAGRAGSRGRLSSRRPKC